MNHLWSPWRMEYIQATKSDEVCVFCWAASQPDSHENLIVTRGQQAFVILNRYPYTSGHIMVVPFEHQSSLELLGPETRAEMMEMATDATRVLGEIYHPQGFNLGINLGEAAGAGIADHIHLHIVPRWGGDTNFMSSVGGTRVMPESLEDSWERIRAGWK